MLIARHDTVTADWQDMAKGLQKAISYLHRSINQAAKQTVQVSDKNEMAGIKHATGCCKSVTGLIGSYRLFINL